jgi:hypothetical protein
VERLKQPGPVTTHKEDQLQYGQNGILVMEIFNFLLDRNLKTIVTLSNIIQI